MIRLVGQQNTTFVNDTIELFIIQYEMNSNYMAASHSHVHRMAGKSLFTSYLNLQQILSMQLKWYYNIIAVAKGLGLVYEPLTGHCFLIHSLYKMLY